MLNMTDAHQGKAHVSSAVIGYHNIGQFGYLTGYFPSDDPAIGRFDIEILSNNKIRLKDGVGVFGGRRFNNGGNLDISLSSGATGEKRIDVIELVHNQDDGGIESITTNVVKGKPTTGTPSMPVSGSTGPILPVSGSYTAPFIVVEFDGVNIIRAELHPDFPAIRSVYNISDELKNKIISGSNKDVKIVVTNQQMTFSNGEAEKSLSSITSVYNKKIVSAWAQMINASTAFIMSVSHNGDTVKMTAGKTDGSKYTGNPTVKILLFLA